MLASELTDIFATTGPLARSQPGYQPRPAQLELAQAIARAIASRTTLIAEAGTGTGKTWAYLIPAILAGGKVLVSTGTRTLQDQLHARDLPRVREALAAPVTTALLKGRSNYVCHYHLARLRGDERGLRSRAEIRQLRHIETFAQNSRTGDKAELAEVPEDAEIWQRATSTRENCLGQDCPNVRDCFLLKARRAAQDADVVVINHALFMADLALREEGVSELLPRADTVIFDEAHQLPDTATRFLGESLSSHQLLTLCRTVETAGLAYARESTNWSEACRALENAVRQWRLACAPLERLPGRKATLQALPDPAAFDEGLSAVRAHVRQLAELLDGVAEKHPDLDAAARASHTLAEKLGCWRITAPDAEASDATNPGINVTTEATTAATTAPTVRWVELGVAHLRLHSAPLSVAETFAQCRQADQAWILTSATLSVHGDFSHYLTQLGLHDATTRRWESPFDYATQALLFVPRDLPLPHSPEYLARFVQTLLPLVAANPGGTLILCTTLVAVDRIAQMLTETLAESDDEPDNATDDLIEPPRAVLRQGDMPRPQLLQRFQTLPRAILVGSASFWEGIDLPGDAVTLVAIDKLPFAPPDDPVLEARLRACRTRGGNPFAEYQLPDAALALKQGAGRLIRSEQDWGVLMVGDARLVDKPYGKRLWRGLPPFTRTRELEQVLTFYARRGANEKKEATT